MRIDANRIEGWRCDDAPVACSGGAVVTVVPFVGPTAVGMSVGVVSADVGRGVVGSTGLAISDGIDVRVAVEAGGA